MAILFAAEVRRWLTAVGVGLGVLACLAGPFAWTAETVASGHHSSLPTAGPSGEGEPSGQGGPGGQGSAFGQDGAGGLLGGGDTSDELVSLLLENASGYRWVAATTGSQNAAGYQLASELPVMAIGGFNGSDPAPTLAPFSCAPTAPSVQGESGRKLLNRPVVQSWET